MKKMMVLPVVGLLLLCCGCGPVASILGQETEPSATDYLGELPEFLFQIADSLNLTVELADGTRFGPYRTYEIPDSLRLGSYTVVETADLTRYDRWLTIAAGNNRAKLTVYDGYRDLLCYESGENVQYYEDSDGETLERLRRDFDSMEFEMTRYISFVSSGDPSGPLREFAGSAYPRFRMNLSAGSRFRFEDYDLIDYRVSEQTDTTISGTISYYAKALPEELPAERVPGTGKFEGWYFCTESVLLELQEDGQWHRVDAFTHPPQDPEATEAAS